LNRVHHFKYCILPISLVVTLEISKTVSLFRVVDSTRLRGHSLRNGGPMYISCFETCLSWNEEVKSHVKRGTNFGKSV